MADGPAVAVRALRKIIDSMKGEARREITKQLCAQLNPVADKLEGGIIRCLNEGDWKCVDNLASEGVFLQRISSDLCKVRTGRKFGRVNKD